jgi:hypothetical protein
MTALYHNRNFFARYFAKFRLAFSAKSHVSFWLFSRIAPFFPAFRCCSTKNFGTAWERRVNFL